MEPELQREERIRRNQEAWRTLQGTLYDFCYPHKLEWPATCARWGNVVQSGEGYLTQEVLFGCRTDGEFDEQHNLWDGLGSFLV